MSAMEKKRHRGAPRTGMSSPPRSTRAGSETAECVPDIVTRTFDLVTSLKVIPFYILAGAFSFHYGPTAPTAPSPRPLDHVIVKVLPLVYLMDLVRHPPETTCPFHDHARRYIMMGLVLSGIGDGLLALDPGVYLVCWYGLSCLAHLSYSIAFFQYYQRSKWSKIVFPIALILVGSLIYLIQEPQTWAIIVVYSLFLTLLGFLALSRLEVCRTGAAYLGWAGVKLFVLSDYLFALNLLVPSLDRPVSDTVVVMTYYLGQLGIALSTYTIKLCPGDEQPISGKSDRSRRSDSSVSVNLSRSGTAQ